ncbi:hypothetical protein V494_03360 [Pseudogymnoascus sp. VKM F-4513 (FW-928)]|nr:hypothetical protein V494_03360 [Pseudogymnoascus sp. VKM F-4513 (FW-928)]
MKGGYKKPIYRPHPTEYPTAGPEAQSEEERDVEITTAVTTSDQPSPSDPLLDQLHEAATGDAYAFTEFSPSYFELYIIVAADLNSIAYHHC